MTQRFHLRALLAVILPVAFFFLWLHPGKSQPPVSQYAVSRGQQKVTFTRDIAPLIFKECASCHRPGESGPFSLLNYQEVKSRARQIAAVVRTRYMPPWLPDPGYEEFVGERRLSDAQIQLFQAWVREGEMEGSPSDLPPLPKFSGSWELGPPDLIVRILKPYRLRAGGSDVFRNFVLPLHLKETKYVRAIEVHPGDKRVVHHANILIDTTRSWRRLDGKDGQPGFPGILDQTEARSDSFNPPSHFLFWRPGTVPYLEPADMSWRLTPRTDLILNMHLQPSGKVETVQPEVGLYFASQPPTRHPMLLQLEDDGAIDIPPGDPDFVVSDHLTLPVGVTLLAIGPHAHYLGKQIETWAMFPDGARKELLKISHWDINWQGVYYYHHPLWLPKGTTVEMRITYDNSVANPRNPNNPPARVRAGVRAVDEMGHVWLQVLPKQSSAEDPRIILAEALMRRRLEKYPGDFVALCNLGDLLVMQKRFREATADFHQALQADPNSATARNGLGACLLAGGHFDDAIRQFQEALKRDPVHFNARLNLARALVAKNDLAGATAELKKLENQDPGDADVQFGLGTIYFMQHDYDQASAHFQKAIRLKPQDAAIQTNFGALLASRGDLTGAINAFEEALKIDPGLAIARAYLARAQEALRKRSLQRNEKMGVP